MPGSGSESERRAEEFYLNVLVQIYELFPTYARKLLFFSVQFVQFPLVSSEILSEISLISLSVRFITDASSSDVILYLQ